MIKIALNFFLVLVNILLVNGQDENLFYRETNFIGVAKNLEEDFGANGSDTLDDSFVLQKAINQISELENGGVIRIPRGTYYFSNIYLKSKVHLEFHKNARVIPTMQPNDKNYFIFRLDGNNEIIEDVSIRGIEGKFAVVLTNLNNKNVTVFRLGNVANFLIDNVHIVDDITKFSCIATGISKLGDGYNYPKNGIIKNCSVENAHYGYGLVQTQAGENILFADLWGSGGVTLRFETGYKKMNKLQVGGVFNLVGRNIYCKNGNAALMVSPHATQNGHIEVDSVVSENCGFAVRIGKGYTTKSQANMGLQAGKFANTSKVSNVYSTFGSTAHVKPKHFKYMRCEQRQFISSEKNLDEESYTAPSIAPVLNTANGAGEGKFHIEVSNVFQYEFPIKVKNKLSERDAIHKSDCH